MKFNDPNYPLNIYTKDEIIKALRNRYRSYNYGSQEPMVEGLTIEQLEAIGHVLLAMKDLELEEA